MLHPVDDLRGTILSRKWPIRNPPLLNCYSMSASATGTASSVTGGLFSWCSLACLTRWSLIWQRFVQVRTYGTDHGSEISAHCLKGMNTPAQPLDVWSIWRDSDEVGNRYVRCVQLCWTLSAPTEHAKSEEEGRWTTEPLDSLIGGVLANQRCVSEYCVRRSFQPTVIPRFHALHSWHEASCYVPSGGINCVRLVMPRCMFSMQLFLSEIVKLHFDRKWRELCA